MDTFWSGAAAISSVVSTVVILVTVVYASRQLREMQAARAIDTIINLHKGYMSPDLHTTRRRLHASGVGDMSDEDRERLRELLNQIELLGILARYDYIDLNLVVATFPDLPLTWAAVEEFVRDQRRLRPFYAANIEDLAKRYPARSPGRSYETNNLAHNHG